MSETDNKDNTDDKQLQVRVHENECREWRIACIRLIKPVPAKQKSSGPFFNEKEKKNM